LIAGASRSACLTPPPKGRNPVLVYCCSAVMLALGLYSLIERTAFA
jgi:hypothetical protein